MFPTSLVVSKLPSSIIDVKWTFLNLQKCTKEFCFRKLIKNTAAKDVLKFGYPFLTWPVSLLFISYSLICGRCDMHIIAIIILLIICIKVALLHTWWEKKIQIFFRRVPYPVWCQSLRKLCIKKFQLSLLILTQCAEVIFVKWPTRLNAVLLHRSAW